MTIEAELDVLGTQAAQLLAKGKLLEARRLLLDAWQKNRHSVLADLIDATDVSIARAPGACVPELFEQHEMYAFSHDWREWFTRDPDEVANRLAIFEPYPDPAATRIILEILLVAPPQLLIAERLWSVVGRVLTALADVRALNSLVSFVDGNWPSRRTHLAIQSVPHLQSAIAALKALPPEPPLELPPALHRALASEFETVRTCAEVAPRDQVEEYEQLARFAERRSPEARLLLGDWLAERGDARGLLINSDRAAVASPEVECLRVRAAQRWASTASHPVLEIAVRAGLPFAVTMGSDTQSRSHRATVGRSKYGLSTTWPLWPLITSITVTQWDDSLLETLELVDAVEELRQVPWRAARTLDLRSLRVLHTDEDGVPLTEVVRSCSQLREFQGACNGSWRLFDELRSLERIALTAEVTRESVAELAAREVTDRRLHTPWCEHRLSGRPGALQIETRVSAHWFMAFEDLEEDGPDREEQLFAQLDETEQAFRGLAEWRFSPGNEARVEALREWVESRSR